MKRYEVVVAPGAQDEIAEAFAFVAAESTPEAAMEWLKGLAEVMASLQAMPERCPIAPESAHFPSGTVRRALYFKHRVLFAVEGATVRVLHVRHGMRSELKEI